MPVNDVESHFVFIRARFRMFSKLKTRKWFISMAVRLRGLLQAHLIQAVGLPVISSGNLTFMGPCIVRIFQYIYIYIYIYTTRCSVTQFIWKLLYMFRVVPAPIIRSADNCIYSIWNLSHRYCYLPLSWKSWNRFECAVGGVRHPQHTQTRVTNTRCCR